MKRFLTIAAVTAALSISAAAADPGHKATYNAKSRQGVRSGELTNAERARVQAAQTQLQKQYVRSATDGRGITAKEAARLKANANQNDRLLYRKKHNGRER